MHIDHEKMMRKMETDFIITCELLLYNFYMDKFTIVIPVYNEAKNLKILGTD